MSIQRRGSPLEGLILRHVLVVGSPSTEKVHLRTYLNSIGPSHYVSVNSYTQKILINLYNKMVCFWDVVSDVGILATNPQDVILAVIPKWSLQNYKDIIVKYAGVKATIAILLSSVHHSIETRDNLLGSISRDTNIDINNIFVTDFEIQGRLELFVRQLVKRT